MDHMIYTWLTWEVLVAASIMMSKWNVWLYMEIYGQPTI